MVRHIIVLAILVSIPSISFSQTTWYVPDDFPGGIQAAISDSSVVNGDTIIVRPGTYVENIDFLGKAITVISELGSGVTTIDGNQSGNVVQFIKSQTGKRLREKFPYMARAITRGGGIWPRGYFVSTVGVDEHAILNYVKHQDKGQMTLDF